jgi:hypothetical protein
MKPLSSSLKEIRDRLDAAVNSRYDSTNVVEGLKAMHLFQDRAPTDIAKLLEVVKILDDCLNSYHQTRLRSFTEVIRDARLKAAAVMG